MSAILHLDLETQNHPYLGHKSSPRHPENYVVMVGRAIDRPDENGQMQMGAREHWYYNSKEEAEDWLDIPDEVTLLVAHNAPFELDWMLVQQREKILAFIKRGGRVFCTAYGHYLLSNQQDTYPALDEVAPMYGGSHKVDGIKILWNQGVLTADIDPALLTEYLIGDQGDIENTRRVFYGEMQQLVQRGMWNMALTRMEGMLFCALAVDAGLFVHRQTAMRQLKQLQKETDELTCTFKVYRTHIDPDCDFKETSRFQMSAWLFGGALKFDARVPSIDEATGKERMEKADFYKFANGIEVEVPEAGFSDTELASLEWDHGKLERYKSGKNKDLPKPIRKDTDRVKMKNGKRVQQLGPLIDLAKLPQDIKKAFDREFTGKQKLADETPVYSTSADAIEVLAKRSEFSEGVQDVLQSLSRFAKVNKDLGTYYLREECDEEGNVVKQSGMLQYLRDDDYINHGLNCTSTVTSRLSSTKPRMLGL